MDEAYPIGITCQELVELVTEYLEGALDRDTHARFEQHLAACRGCSDYLDQMQLTIRATGHLGQESLEPAATEALLNVFKDWKRGH
jgi:predicted anti-sigma-YlaC factor YlaD